MFLKIKKALQQTFIYTIYIFFVDLIRNRKKKINKVKAKWTKFYNLRILFPRIYKKYSKLPVDENKVIFVEVRLPEITNSYKVIYDELANKYNYTIHCHFLRNVFLSKKKYRERCCELMKDFATAKYIFVDDGCDVLNCVEMRPETVMTQVWHGCGAFKKFGFSTAELIFGLNRKQMLKYPAYKNITNVTVSSPEVVWAFEEAMGFENKPGVVKPTGVSRTDVFYDEEFKRKSFEKLHKVMPESIGKKVILYAPTFRGRVAKATSSKMLSIKMFQEALGDEYVLLFKHHFLVKKTAQVSIKYDGFAKDVTESMTIEELLCVADICISDYSSLIFEYSIFERPLIFFAYDIDEYNDWRGFYYNYDELTPGPVLTSNLEMIDYIKNIDTLFDKEQVHQFREKFMASCDGHATERILDVVFGKSLEEHRKPQNEATALPLHKIPEGFSPFSKRENDIEKLKAFGEEAAAAYKNACENPIEKGKVALVLSAQSSAAITLGELLENDGSFSVVRADSDTASDASTLATAQFVVVQGVSKLINVLELRQGTQLIELTDTSLPVIKTEYASIRYKAGYDNDITAVAPLHGKYSLVTVASDFAKKAYGEIYNITDESVFSPIGSITSDILFDEDFIKATRERIVSVFPNAENKKIIFYMPQERIDKVTRPAAAGFFETKMMFEYLKNDYVVLYKYSAVKKNKLSVSKNYRSFICNMDKLPVNEETGEKPTFTDTELMAAADIVIGDYKTASLDFIATEKPIFFFTPDYAVYSDNDDSFIDYEELTAGLRFTDTVEMAKQILDLDSYNYAKLHELKKKYFEYCNGDTGKKLVDKMKEML